MGKLEREVRYEIRRSKLNRAILGTVAVAGGVTLAVLAPQVLAMLGRTKYVRQRSYRFKSSLSRLIGAGYVVLAEEAGKKRVRLTPKGERCAALMGEGKLVPKKPAYWDKKWRVLIFDIPERRRKTRAQIRATLTTLGFVRLQDSVWVFPYDCEDLVTLLKADLKIGKDLLYLIVDKLEYDAPLRAKFALE